MNGAFNDRWFLLATVTAVFAMVFLLTVSEATGGIGVEEFIDTASQLWKFFTGGAIGAALLRLYQSQAANRRGSDRPAGDGSRT